MKEEEGNKITSVIQSIAIDHLATTSRQSSPAVQPPTCYMSLGIQYFSSSLTCGSGHQKPLKPPWLSSELAPKNPIRLRNQTSRGYIRVCHRLLKSVRQMDILERLAMGSIEIPTQMNIRASRVRACSTCHFDSADEGIWVRLHSTS
jgi:hypothetical protein